VSSIEIHNGWFEVFAAEVAWWKAEARVRDPIADGDRVAGPDTCLNRVPVRGHLPVPHLPRRGKVRTTDAPDGPDAEVECHPTGGLSDVQPFRRHGEKTYADPLANTLFRTDITLRCSLAVARDWHRHRTLYPWHLQVVRDQVGGATAQHLGSIKIDHHYAPMSDLAKAKVPALLERSTAVFDRFMADKNIVQAALALPLGTRACGCGVREVCGMPFTCSTFASEPWAQISSTRIKPVKPWTACSH
jgi:hypothetical protein